MSNAADVLRLDDAPVTSRPLTSSGRKAASKAKSDFRRYFDQEELPLTIENNVMGDRQVIWTTPVGALDYQHFLPICFSGLQETLEPYPTFAYRACMDLLEHGMADTRVLRALAALMPHVKSALGTRDKEVVHRTLLVLQQLAVCQGVGEALSEYYRSILPLCNLLKDKHLGTGDSMTKALIQETLEILEGYGKDDAYHQIQQHVPAFQHSNNIK